MFGDIITDLGAIVQGGMGVAASGNINPDGVSMFEPIHGSAPKWAGQNVICPVAAIAAAGMMMEQLGETQCGKAIEQAVIAALGSGQVPLDSSERREQRVTTEATGDLIASLV
jgi:3-isopropylmalate dehydrogenase